LNCNANINLNNTFLEKTTNPKISRNKDKIKNNMAIKIIKEKITADENKK
jgi:hypothetical protein